jgi:NAD dependent epimerase/dehydratase
LTWNERTVLVTGAGGFIGSHLAERLVERGARVRALVRYTSTGRWGWLDHSPLKGEMEVVTGDIADRDSVAGAMRGVDTAFHLAALIGIPYSYEAPESYVRTNITGTLNVLQAGREMGVRRLVQTSTSEVYGTARYAPIDEAHPLQGQSPYSATKIAADKLAESYHRSFGLPVVTLRPFNTYGPRQSARAVIPTIVTQLLAGGPVRLGNLEPTRDLVFVADTVEGFIAAGEAPEAVGETVHLGTGVETSIGDLAQTIARLMGRELRLEQQAERVRPDGSEVERLLAAPERAQALLGWRAQRTLEQGLTETIAWLQAHQDWYRPDAYVR